jgi:hypothetical protein
MTARKTKILLDGGDAQETQRIMKQLGFLDGQTPRIDASCPPIKLLSGMSLSTERTTLRAEGAEA